MYLWKRHPQTHKMGDSESQDAKVTELRAALGPLSGRSKIFCSDACLRRYLKARNWNVDKAKKMLEGTLKWRASYKPEEICWHEIAHEGESGKVFRANFHDCLGRTVLILNPAKQNSNDAENSIRHLVYLIENAILNLPEGQEQMTWIADFTGWSLTTNVSISTARDFIGILQSHYPERLAIGILYNPPRFFEVFWKAVKYFLDPLTFQKVKFVYAKNKDSEELMRSLFDVGNLPSDFGGKATLTYHHEEFSRKMEDDDVKTATFWGIDKRMSHTANGHTRADTAPDLLAAAAAPLSN